MSGEAESKGKGNAIPKPFADELTGIIQTVNFLKDDGVITGARGQMSLSPESVKLIIGLGFTIEGDRVIYKITREKLASWEGDRVFQRGDKVSFGSVYIGQYKGKIVDWKGLLSVILCRDGFVKVEKGERPTSKFQQYAYENPLESTKEATESERKEPAKKSQETKKQTKKANKTKVIGTERQLFETLTAGIEQAEEALSALKKIVSAGEVLDIPEKDFHFHSTKVSLAYHRMFSTMLLILERE